MWATLFLQKKDGKQQSFHKASFVSLSLWHISDNYFYFRPRTEEEISVESIPVNDSKSLLRKTEG